MGSSCSLFPPDSWDHPSPTEQNLLPGQAIPEEAAGVGCSQHPSHPSLWFCNPAEGGRRGNPAWLSGISLRPRVPGLQTPNHGQSWRPNRPEEFRTSNRNRELSTQLLLCSSPSLLQPGHLSMGPGEILDSQTPTQEKRIQKDLEVPPFASAPKGPLSKHGGVLKTSLNPSM